jgi:sodium transport system permease protein
MITILLFASAMNLGTDSFAGEKERGTMASLLITPIKRSQIVYGKLFALMILSGLSALIYGGSLIFAMPLLYKMLGAMTGQNLSFPPRQMCMMLALIVTLVFLYVALIAFFSTLAKNIKEASTFITPVYLIVMVVGIFTIYQGDDVTAMQYLIPLFGPTMALKNVFTLDITVAGFALAIVSNLLTGALFAWLTSRLFHSEKIMFNA